MDLFIDKQYELECENKLDYFRLLYGTGDSPSYSFVGGTPTFTVAHGNVIVIVASEASVGNISVLKPDGSYAYEFRISATAKKFII
jgi:hypothetical protein